MPEPLRFPSRLLLILAAALLPAAAVIWQLTSMLNQEAESARRARAAIEYLGAIKAICKADLDLRHSVSDAFAGPGAAELPPRKTGVPDLNEIDARLGNERTRQHLDEFQSAVTRDRSVGSTFPATGEFLRKSVKEMGALREFAAAVSSGSGGETLVLFLDDADYLSHATFLVRKAARSRRIESADAAELRHVLGRLEHNGVLLLRERSDTRNQLPAVRAALGSQDALRVRAIARIESAVLRDPNLISEPDATAAADAARLAVDNTFDLFDPLSRAIGDGLRQRVAARNRTTTLAFVWLTAGATIALLTTYLIGRSFIQRPITAAPAPVANERLRELVERLRENVDALQVSPTTGALPAGAAGHAARLTEATQQLSQAARQLDDAADETSVAALNVAIGSVAGGPSSAASVDQLAERLAEAMNQVNTLVGTIEAEAGALSAALGDGTSTAPATAAEAVERLKALTSELGELAT